MTKTKASVTLDPAKVSQAQALLGAASLSKVIDIALDRLILDELERRHIAGYRLRPPEVEDDAWANIARDASEIADDVDWASLYGIGPSQ